MQRVYEGAWESARTIHRIRWCRKIHLRHYSINFYGTQTALETVQEDAAPTLDTFVRRRTPGKHELYTRKK